MRDTNNYLPNISRIEVKAQVDDSSGNVDFYVGTARKNVQNKLVKNKLSFCLYCEEFVTNFPRHLERKHALEDNVRQLLVTYEKVKVDDFYHVSFVTNSARKKLYR